MVVNKKKNQSLTNFAKSLKRKFLRMQAALGPNSFTFHPHTLSIIFVNGIKNDTVRNKMLFWLRQCNRYLEPKLTMTVTLSIAEAVEHMYFHEIVM